MNDYPTFEPNSTYEISFLKLSAIWYKRNDAIDLSQFFEYYIENDVLYITDIKAEDWHTAFGNYNFAIPDTLLGYPVVVVIFFLVLQCPPVSIAWRAVVEVLAADVQIEFSVV